MYELLSGKLPFRGDNAVEIALKHLKEPLPSIREECPDLPQAVENVILKACAKNPKNRYPDARSMHEDLKTCTSPLRANEPKYVYKYPEFDEATAERREKAIEKTMEFSKIEDSKDKDKASEVKVKKIEEKDIETKKENKVLVILGAIFAGLAVIAATIVGILVLLPNNSEMQVPNVAGKTVDEAVEIFNNMGLKVNAENKYAQSDEVKEGDVVKTDPSSGRTVKKGSEITLYISQGSNTFEIEDYVGQEVYGVKAILEKVHNLFVIVEEDNVDDPSKYEENKIINQEPAVGTKVKSGDTITLHIAKIGGVYPNFTTGYSLADIQAWGEKYNIKIKEEYVQDNSYEPGSIIKQSKPAGSNVVSGMSITITIAEEETSIDNE